MNILVTGGAGFIGSHYVKLATRLRPNSLVVNVDALTYAGNLDDLPSTPNHVFVKGDIRDGAAIEKLCRQHDVEAVVHLAMTALRRNGVEAVVNFAAETHVDRSIEHAQPFFATNVVGTVCLLEAARAAGVRRFVQVSTDEVYGTLGADGVFDETSPVAPRSPYAASKAAAEHAVMAFHHTYGLDTVITRSSNNYGPRQHIEKLIPRMTTRALAGETLPVYGDGLYVRDWIHVEDHCSAIDTVLMRGVSGEVYNIGAENERANLDVVKKILEHCGRDESLIRHVEDRLGHDRRYAVNTRKLRALGWWPQRSFEEGLAETVAWYRESGQKVGRDVGKQRVVPVAG
jgi:dTDP-glucose 4,6-dehydratase